MRTILVVDDEPKIVQIARDYLQRAGFSVVSASDGTGALATARAAKPDLIVLDLKLPGMDGLDVARELRKTSTVPIIMLTARVDETDKLIGLELGADDYVTKPFSPKELVARIRAVLRRTEAARLGVETIRVGELTLDVPRMQVSVARRAVTLTSTEFQFLGALARQPGRIFPRGQLLDQVHGVAFESYERSIDAHIKNIRRKLEPDPRRPRYIQTVYGVGYKLAEECPGPNIIVSAMVRRRGGRRESPGRRRDRPGHGGECEAGFSGVWVSSSVSSSFCCSARRPSPTGSRPASPGGARIRFFYSGPFAASARFWRWC